MNISAIDLNLLLVLHTALEERSATRRELATMDVRRRIALTVSHFMAAAIAATRTDYLVSLPWRFAVTACRLLPLRIAQSPESKRFPFPVSLFWHQRTDHDDGSCYFRELIVEALRDSSSGVSTLPAPPRRRPRRVQYRANGSESGRRA